VKKPAFPRWLYFPFFLLIRDFKGGNMKMPETSDSQRDPDQNQFELKKEKKRLESKGSQMVLIACVAIILAGIAYHFLKPPRPELKAPPAANSKEGDLFFETLNKELPEIQEGRSYFQRANELRKNTSLDSPDTSLFFRMSEDYSRASERFKHAKQTLESVKIKDQEPSKQICQKEMNGILEKYIQATEIFNENAKLLTQGEKERLLKDLIPDGQAKHELAEKLLSDFLNDVCKGDYLKYMSTQEEPKKQLVFSIYQNFYGSQFAPQEERLNKRLNPPPSP